VQERTATLARHASWLNSQLNNTANFPRLNLPHETRSRGHGRTEQRLISFLAQSEFNHTISGIVRVGNSVEPNNTCFLREAHGPTCC